MCTCYVHVHVHVHVRVKISSQISGRHVANGDSTNREVHVMCTLGQTYCTHVLG